MTNRYTVTSFEAAVVAKRYLRKGELLQHLCGILGEMDGALNPSAVLSTIICTTELKGPREYLLLGLIRFVNHDCKANAELVIQNDNVTARALRGIEKGEEVTVKYVKDYFGPDSSGCLCRSCEIQSLGRWAGEPAGSGNQPTAQRRRALDSTFYPR